MPPLRDTALVERCDQCDQPAAARCKRCNRPACAEHAPEARRRCADCESELDRRLSALGPVPVTKGTLHRFALKIGAVGAIAGAGMGGLAAIIAAASGLLGIGLAALSVLLWVLTYFVFGALGVYACALPWIGARGTIAGSRKIRRALARRKFLAERPGQRELPAPDPDAQADQL